MGRLRFTTAGESHGPELVAMLEGFPAGVPLVAADIDADLARRQRGYGRGGRMKIERDQVHIVAGVRGGETLGSPIALVIANRDHENWAGRMGAAPFATPPEPVTRPRPGHADLAGGLKYDRRDLRDILERASARETAARVAAGAVCKKLLALAGIDIFAHVLAIGPIAVGSAAIGSAAATPGAALADLASARGAGPNGSAAASGTSPGGSAASGAFPDDPDATASAFPDDPDATALDAPSDIPPAFPGPDLDLAALRDRARASDLACADPAAEEAMRAAIRDAAHAGDTLGGVFEVIATGVPPGLGSHVAWDRKLDGRIAQALMSIQAIKGVEIGLGFEAARRRGSAVHDPIAYDPQGHGFPRSSNGAGGLEGGITNGMPLRIRAAMKPIATLKKPLPSVDLATLQPFDAAFERSDVCAVPAASVVGEAMLALTLADALLEKLGGDSLTELRRNLDGYLDQIRRYP